MLKLKTYLICYFVIFVQVQTVSVYPVYATLCYEKDERIAGANEELQDIFHWARYFAHLLGDPKVQLWHALFVALSRVKVEGVEVYDFPTLPAILKEKGIDSLDFLMELAEKQNLKTEKDGETQLDNSHLRVVNRRVEILIPKSSEDIGKLPKIDDILLEQIANVPKHGPSGPEHILISLVRGEHYLRNLILESLSIPQTWWQRFKSKFMGFMGTPKEIIEEATTQLQRISEHVKSNTIYKRPESSSALSAQNRINEVKTTLRGNFEMTLSQFATDFKKKLYSNQAEINEFLMESPLEPRMEEYIEKIYKHWSEGKNVILIGSSATINYMEKIIKFAMFLLNSPDHPLYKKLVPENLMGNNSNIQQVLIEMSKFGGDSGILGAVNDKINLLIKYLTREADSDNKVFLIIDYYQRLIEGQASGDHTANETRFEPVLSLLKELTNTRLIAHISEEHQSHLRTINEHFTKILIDEPTKEQMRNYMEIYFDQITSEKHHFNGESKNIFLERTSHYWDTINYFRYKAFDGARELIDLSFAEYESMQNNLNQNSLKTEEIAEVAVENVVVTILLGILMKEIVLQSF